MGAKGTATGGVAALGKKLDLAAVDATAGGNEGTVICAKRADGRAARTNCSVAGAALAGLDSTEEGTDSTLVALIFLDWGDWATGAFFTAWVTAEDRVGLLGAANLEAADETDGVFTFSTFTGTGGWVAVLALTAGFTAALAAGFTAALAAGFTAALAAGFTAALTAGFTAALTAGFTAALAGGFVATLATLDFEGGAFEATAVFTGGFVLFGVFTSCLLAVSKGRLLTVCPCAADPKPVHLPIKPLL
jgi:hypothetical protein